MVARQSGPCLSPRFQSPRTGTRTERHDNANYSLITRFLVHQSFERFKSLSALIGPRCFASFLLSLFLSLFPSRFSRDTLCTLVESELSSLLQFPAFCSRLFFSFTFFSLPPSLPFHPFPGPFLRFLRPLFSFAFARPCSLCTCSLAL